MKSGLFFKTILIFFITQNLFGCGVTVEQGYENFEASTYSSQANRIPIFEPDAISKDRYKVVQSLHHVVCRGGKGKFRFGGNEINAKLAFKLEAFQLGADAVVNFRCSQTSVNLQVLGEGCLSGIVCDADAASF